jgi:hypothetical protein
MTLHSFPKALETAAPSDRDVVPLRVPVAPIAVRCQVYSVTNSSSQAGDDGWPGVPRYISIRSIPGPFSSNSDLGWSRNRIGAGHSTLALSRWQRVVRYSRCTFFNLGGAYGLHSLFSSLRKFLQEPRGVLTVFTSPCPLRVVAHEQQRSERSLSWVTRNMLRVTKCL